MLCDVIGHDDLKYKLKKLSEKPPKVMLFTGPLGVGKKHTALHFIDEMHNGYLTSKLFTHPDIHILEPDTKTFKLELVNNLKSNLVTTPFELSKKYFILNNIDLMNKESANACLKIFEDCPNYVHFILLSKNIEVVLDTVKSRSMAFNFQPIPNLKDYYPMLSDLEIKLMRGCPGNLPLVKNLKLTLVYDDLLKFISNFENLSMDYILEWFSGKEECDLDILIDLLIICCSDLYKSDNSLEFLTPLLIELKYLKNKTHLNLNIKMHLKNALIQAKNKI